MQFQDFFASLPDDCLLPVFRLINLYVFHSQISIILTLFFSESARYLLLWTIVVKWIQK